MADQILIGDIRGKSGNRGQTGSTPLINVAIDNLPAGSTPTVGVSGSVDSPLITFGIPAQDAGTVVVFNHQGGQSVPTIDIPENKTAQEYWQEIYDLASQREIVRFFYVIPNDANSFWDMQYYVQNIEDNKLIHCYVNDNGKMIWLDWYEDGTIGNYKYIDSDFIIEESTATTDAAHGNLTWNYIKWNSGRIELELSSRVSATDVNLSNNLYRCTCEVPIPKNLLVDTQSNQVVFYYSAKVEESNGWDVSGGAQFSGAESATVNKVLTLYSICSSSQEVTSNTKVRLWLHLDGHWK